MSGKHKRWTRAEKASLNRISGKILTWAKDEVRQGDMTPEEGRGVAKFCQAVLSARPHRIREAKLDLSTSVPPSMLMEMAAVAGEAIL